MPQPNRGRSLASHVLGAALLAGALALPPAVVLAQAAQPSPGATPAAGASPAATPARPDPQCGPTPSSAQRAIPAVLQAAPPAQGSAPAQGTASPQGTPGAQGTPDATASPEAPAGPDPALIALAEQLRGLTRELVTELFRIDQEVVVAASKLRQAEDELVEVTAQAQALEAELAAKQAALEQLAAAYGARLRTIYKYTRRSPLEELLSAQDFGETLRRLTMLQAIARVDNRLIGQLREERQALIQATNELQEKQKVVTALRDEIDQQHQILLVRREEQATIVARAQEQQTRVELALAQDQANALASRISSLQAEHQQELLGLERQRPAPAQLRPGLSAGVPGVAAPARPAGTALLWPIVNSMVTTEYGEPTFAQPYHTGIDLAQRLYAPVLAAADGIVIACGLAVPGDRSQSYGMMVVVAHDRSLSTLYAHLEDEVLRPPVKVGERVRRGQILGFIGLTGLTTGPHLHFEVRVDGHTQNPRDFLSPSP
jgi:murein DD-endopeptidase MepM/ murein hydrolase activator NlpD